MPKFYPSVAKNVLITFILFPQEAFFTWSCGVREPGCFLAVQGGSGAATLFVPRLPADYAVWMGRLLTLQDFKTLYAVEEVFYVDQASDLRLSLR